MENVKKLNNMTYTSKIAIVYLVYYHNEAYIDDMAAAVKNMTYPKDLVELVIVINPHEKYGPFVHYIEETLLPESGKSLPHITILVQDTNTGFAEGSNIGINWAIEHEFDYAYMHNNDGFVAANAFEPLVDAMDADKTIGAAQSLMLLHPETALINSTGNAIQFLGFGFCKNYKVRLSDLQLEPIEEVGYPSGAAVLLRCSTVKDIGGYDEDYWLYHEDLELGLRMRIIGLRSVMVKSSVFYHKYQFARSVTKLFWMERNRYGTMLIYFNWLTLLLLLPVAIPVELGLIAFSLKGGWFKERVKAYAYWLKISNWKLWLGKRKRIRALKKVSDRKLLLNTVSGIHFQDKMTDNVLVNKLANPVLKVYYWIVVKGIIRW